MQHRDITFTEKNVKLVIADEMDLALAGIQTVLRPPTPCEIVGAYTSLAALLADLAQIHPDVILLSDHLDPDLDPLSLVERVQAAAPQALLILTSPLARGQFVHELFNVGVSAFLYKSDPLSEEIEKAIRGVMRRRPYLSPTANAEYLFAIQSGRTAWMLDAEALDVLRLLRKGRRPQEIALMRGVRVRRIYWVTEKLRGRFGADTNEQLMIRAAEEGFLG